MENQPLPGSKLLQSHLDKTGQSLRGFCLENKLDASELSKLLRGKRKRVSVPVAVAIEDATKGKVPIRSWMRA